MPADDEHEETDELARGAVKPFLGHLQDLRTALVRILGALLAGCIVAIPLAKPVLRVLRAPLAAAGKDPLEVLKIVEVTGGFRIWMHVAIWTGVLIAAPAIVFCAGQFVFPGLTPKERRVVLRSSGFALAFFAGGVLVGYFAILPMALRVMFGLSEKLGVATDFVLLTDYVTFCSHVMLGFGVAFELPVLLVVLGRLGVVTSAQLAGARSYVVVGILIVAALLTPPDVFTQLLMAVPLWALFEVSVLMIRSAERRRGGSAAR